MHPVSDSRPPRAGRIAWPRLMGLATALVGSAAFWVWIAGLLLSR